ncbi:hypothetical protein [Streptomyces sp. MST-110588]|uniref:hypothetical protein n=1 Tax=Streptomyces sp. MST-110588 TaxID=2833628 RepID=UPI001F5E1C0D|nr:hypothetical protein [Streptomyces sp. MST-110588]UNO43457.1 hypothetical protein KGS77_33235 [Streptomyces sp. MST-110588]
MPSGPAPHEDDVPARAVGGATGVAPAPAGTAVPPDDDTATGVVPGDAGTAPSGTAPSGSGGSEPPSAAEQAGTSEQIPERTSRPPRQPARPPVPAASGAWPP